MRFNEIEKDQWMRYLAPHLKGKALSLYSALDEDSDCDEVKLAILRRFSVNAETYRQRLRTTKLKTGDDVTDLAIQVYTLTDRWLQNQKIKWRQWLWSSIIMQYH